jgi:hypothetical protein
VTLALDTDQAKNLAIGLVVVILVAGVLVNFVVGHIIARVVVLAMAIALAVVVWTQRSDIESAAKNCDASFLGVHLTPSDPTLKAHCQQVTNR